MSGSNELLQEFYALFGNNGGDRRPGNVDISRTVVNVCQDLMKIKAPVLFEYFRRWDDRVEEKDKPFGIEQFLLRVGQWEGAWALAQLHYDQFVKCEAKCGFRQHKGHPLCNLALIGQVIPSPSLTRHYALLSSVGDVYWEDQDPGLRFGGLAPTILERFESTHQQYRWRDSLRMQMRDFNNRPVYLEAFLASRWFTDEYAQYIKEFAEMKSQCGKPFIEVLLDAVKSPNNAHATATGTRFEAVAGLLLSATPGFEVDSGRKTTDEQIDLVIYYLPEPWAPIGLEPGFGLVECKSAKRPIQSKELRDFGAKCLFHRVRFGILIARVGITGGSDKFEEPQNAELLRRRFQLDGLTLLVLDIDDLHGKSRELRGVQHELSADYKELAFGPVS